MEAVAVPLGDEAPCALGLLDPQTQDVPVAHFLLDRVGPDGPDPADVLFQVQPRESENLATVLTR